MATSRYRREGDSYCIDLRLREIRQLFDLRDPAPFRERDLDPGAVEYLIEAAEETPSRAPLKVAVFVAEERDRALTDGDIQAAIHAHFEHSTDMQGLRIRRHMRQGRTAVVVGLVMLTACLLIANSINATTTGQRVLREGLTIGGWVAIWRPIEHFLYDWWPILSERRLLKRIQAAPVTLHWGAPRTRTIDAVSPDLSVTVG